MLVGPNELKVGDVFKLTGKATNPRERDEKRTFKILDVCEGDHNGGAHIFVEASDGEQGEMTFAPWVQVILIPKAQA